MWLMGPESSRETVDIYRVEEGGNDRALENTGGWGELIGAVVLDKEFNGDIVKEVLEEAEKGW